MNPSQRAAIGRPPKAAKGRERYDNARHEVENRAYHAHLAGRTNREIAAELGVSDRQVRTYLKRASERLSAELKARDGAAGVAHHYAVLHYVLSEAIGSWKETRSPAFLTTALAASRELRNLVGMDAPEVQRLIVEQERRENTESFEELRLLPTEVLLKRYRAVVGISPLER
jgi:predicted transcriptional regulator